MKIAITGGHLTPALATIDALRKKDPGVAIVWFGRKKAQEGDQTPSEEYRRVTSLGMKFVELRSGRLQRKFTRFTIPSILRLPQGFWTAFFSLRREKPDVLLAFGGYLSTPLVVSAWLMKVPVVIHEQAVTTGLANRVNAHFARKVAVSWSLTLPLFPKKKTVLTGNPIREAILGSNQHQMETDLSKWLGAIDDKRKKPLIFVTGGNQGSHFINTTIKGILRKLSRHFQLIIQTGGSYEKADFYLLKREVKRLELEKKVFVADYLYDYDIGLALRSCDFLVSRSGANTVSEILTLEKPAILIPLPWAGYQEQMKNAQLVRDCDLGVILEQESLTGEKLYSEVLLFSKNLSRFVTPRKKAKEIVKKNAAKLIADQVFEVAKKKVTQVL